MDETVKPNIVYCPYVPVTNDQIIKLRSLHPSVAACTPFMFKPADLNDDYVECSVCHQGWFRESAPDSWGPFTVKSLPGKTLAECRAASHD
jgi:hypothetical protein